MDGMQGSEIAASRRAVLAGGLAFGAFALLGCSAELEESEPARLMTVYRDLNCGCCEAWARIAGDAGYAVKMVEDADIASVKRRLGVPAQLASCHTALVGGYVVEGHVPIADIDRLLAERPARVRGIAVPGMPVGSPGMEAPDGRVEPYQVVAFDAAGNLAIYRG
jgi:hypothetical protein